MQNNEIPTFCVEGDYDDEDAAFYNCPYSGVNTLSEDWNSEVFPPQLVYFAMGLALEDTEYVKPEFKNLLDEFNEGKMEDDPKFEDYEWFHEYLVTILPKEKPYYVLQVDHPDGVIGDWNIHVYEGTFEEA